MGTPLWMWVVFLVIIISLLAFDLGILHRQNREIGIKESLYASLGYIVVSILFGIWIWTKLGHQKGAEFITGYLIEKSLSIDNIFVISLVFTYFAIPRKYQYHTLFWGIIGVIIFRGVMIGLGAAIVAKFSWVLYLFAIFLIYTGFKMIKLVDNLPDIKSNKILRFIRRHFDITEDLHGDKFFVKIQNENYPKGKWFLTPLFVALILIECMDVVFAVDSVPAIFAITTDPFIIYTSNIFAILGLRALYFALAALIVRFTYLKYAISALLIFIGSKIFIADLLGIEKFPPVLALVITFLILASGVLVSLFITKRSKKLTK